MTSPGHASDNRAAKEVGQDSCTEAARAPDTGRRPAQHNAIPSRVPQCPHGVSYNGGHIVRCEKPRGHKGVHYAKTALGGTAWPTPSVWSRA